MKPQSFVILGVLFEQQSERGGDFLKFVPAPRTSMNA